MLARAQTVPDSPGFFHRQHCSAVLRRRSSGALVWGWNLEEFETFLDCQQLSETVCGCMAASIIIGSYGIAICSSCT
jgi:hypothetical protein